MKVCLFHNKHNRPLYQRIFASFVEGCTRVGANVTYSSLCSDADLFVVCNRAPSKIDIYRDFAKECDIPLVACDTTVVTQKGLQYITRRDEARRDGRGDILIYCEHGTNYVRGTMESKIDWGHTAAASCGGNYILIPEQIRPEIRHSVYGAIEWTEWLHSTRALFPNNSITISLHPNRKFGKKWQFDTALYDELNFSVVKPPFAQHIPQALHIHTLSSWAVLDAIVAGKSTSFQDSYCPISDGGYDDWRDWLMDFSWCFWSLKEIANGDYLDYFKENLWKHR